MPSEKTKIGEKYYKLAGAEQDYRLLSSTDGVYWSIVYDMTPEETAVMTKDELKAITILLRKAPRTLDTEVAAYSIDDNPNFLVVDSTLTEIGIRQKNGEWTVEDNDF